MQRFIKITGLVFSNCLAFLVVVILIGRSDALPADDLERVRRFTRAEEFNYVQWMLDALTLKNAQAALDPARYMSIAEQRETIFRHLDLVATIDRLNYDISVVYADPNEKDPQAATAEKREALKTAQAEEEIAQGTLRRQYEHNYLAARQALGRGIAERLFPGTNRSQSNEPTPPPAVPAIA
jgi:hypothetical protein